MVRVQDIRKISHFEEVQRGDVNAWPGALRPAAFAKI
jgi:hypothetical protein